MTGKDTVPVILLINGPNLNMLGKRSREHYGSFTLAQVESAFRTKAEALGVEAKFFQSNDEGAIVTAIHQSMQYASGIVVNAGAYTHYSYAIRDALASLTYTKVEVHISDITKREDFRKISVTAPVCDKQIYGLGLEGYLKAIDILLKKAD